MLRAEMDRKMHREGWLPPDQHVNEAWEVALLSLKINQVDCTERERGSRWSRGLGRVTGGTPGAIYLTDVHLWVRTSANIYPVAAALVLIARSTESAIELAWITQKSPEEEQRPRVIPVGDWSANFNYFAARLDGHDQETAQRIVDQITETRDAGLALAPPENRATIARMIQDMADLDLD
jgi:hypothetical protein